VQPSKECSRGSSGSTTFELNYAKYLLYSSRLPALILWVPMKMNGAVMASSWVRAPMGLGPRVHNPRRPGCVASA
jgi:hypothetical protein